MKYPEFITAIEEYYGPYNSEIQKKMTAVYVKERWDESLLDGIFKQLTLKKSAKYKTPPDPAEFEELFPRESLESKAARWFDELSRTGNSLDHVIISDLRAQEAIMSFGGWPAFCQRKPEDELWHRKNFISAYTKAIPEGLPQILFGESTRREKLPLMFGDKGLCAAALEYNKSESLKMISNMAGGMKI